MAKTAKPQTLKSTKCLEEVRILGNDNKFVHLNPHSNFPIHVINKEFLVCNPLIMNQTDSDAIK